MECFPFKTGNKAGISALGQPGWLSGLGPPSAQGVNLETRDRGPHQAHCMEWSLLLPLPVSLPLSLSMSLMNK